MCKFWLAFTFTEEKSGRAVPLVYASSGLWSIVPSALVTSYLAAQSELERFMTSGISKSVSNETLAEITTVANKYTNSFFLNVVEGPAQNLFLESQMKNLAFLLEAANVNYENKIVMTTHSPYVLSYITLAAKAYELMNKGLNVIQHAKTKRTAIGTLLSNDQFAMRSE